MLAISHALPTHGNRPAGGTDDGMPGRANDLIAIPDSFWQRHDTVAALHARNMGQLFALVHQYAGASQTQIGIACGMTQGRISRTIRGLALVEELEVFERIADGLGMPDSARIALGLAPRSPLPPGSRRVAQQAMPAGDATPDLDTTDISDLLNLDLGEKQEEDSPVRRRTFVRLTGATTISAIIAEPAADRARAGVDPFAPILTTHAADGSLTQPSPPPDISALAAEVNNARRQYQACRYSELSRQLPSLLARLYSACAALTGDAQGKAFALSADAHHVAAGLLLKLDDRGLAYLAADRSMRAAQASQDPVTIGASARIITHTLMDGGHLPAAISTASSYAAQLDRDVESHTPESLSVYGALLLRGSIAAAQSGKRGTAHELLDEADEAGKRLGVDGNLRWTAFGPTNATVHRVNIAVTLGDAGTAIDVARAVDLSKIPVTERKASLLIDVSRAFLQWGRHEKAYIALRAAEATAHEEVSGRPSVHRLIRELLATAPPSVRRDAEEFAVQIGVSR
jgi:transcriptional regulator with XRE-family HTH domain